MRPRLRNQAFQQVSRALLEAKKHLRGSWKGWGLHIGAKRDLAGPKCFVHIGVETRKMFSFIVCLRERVGSNGKAQSAQWWDIGGVGDLVWGMEGFLCYFYSLHSTHHSCN